MSLNLWWCSAVSDVDLDLSLLQGIFGGEPKTPLANFTFLLVADGFSGATTSSSKRPKTSHPSSLPLDLVGPRREKQNELLSGFNMVGLVNFQETWYSWLSDCCLNESRWTFHPLQEQGTGSLEGTSSKKLLNRRRTNRFFQFSNSPPSLTTLVRFHVENTARYTGPNVLSQPAQCKHFSAQLSQKIKESGTLRSSEADW